MYSHESEYERLEGRKHYERYLNVRSAYIKLEVAVSYYLNVLDSQEVSPYNIQELRQVLEETKAEVYK